MALLILISILVFLLNVPFGYWRANVRRLSLQWYLAIHIPVPFIIALRLLSDIGFAWHTYVFLVGSFFLGQQVGARMMRWIHAHCTRNSCCMVMDLYRCART